MIQKLLPSLKILNNQSLRQSVFLSTATIVNSALGLVFYVLVARSLSVSEFGYSSFLVAFGVLFADLFDFGLGTALVKFVRLIPFPQIFTVVTIARLITLIVLVAASAIVGQFYSANFFLSALLAVSLLFVYQITQSFLAWQKLLPFSATNLFGNCVRILLVVILVQQKILSAENSLLIMIIANLLAAIFGTALVIKSTKMPLFSLENFRSTVKTVTKFSGWLGLSFGAGAISSRIDIPLVYLLAGPIAAGIYSSAQKLASVLPQLTSAIDGVFAPKIVALRDGPVVHREYLFVAATIAIGLVVLSPLLGWVVPIILGAKYSSSIPALQILFWSAAIMALAGPFSAAILYRYGKSSYHFLSSFLQLVLSVGLYFIFVPRYQAIGAAIATLFANLFLTVTYIYFLTRLRLHHVQK